MSRYSVLIVDDEKGVLNALRRALAEENYELFLAEGPRQALEILERTPIDVVISDHRMPRMTGLDLLTRVRENWPDTLRFMLTGQADMGTVVDAINLGEVHRFLLKPWDDDDLRLKLHMALGQLELQRENRRLFELVEAQVHSLAAIEHENPGIFSVERDESGAVIINE